MLTIEQKKYLPEWVVEHELYGLQHDTPTRDAYLASINISQGIRYTKQMLTGTETYLTEWAKGMHLTASATGPPIPTDGKYVATFLECSIVTGS